MAEVVNYITEDDALVIQSLWSIYLKLLEVAGKSSSYAFEQKKFYHLSLYITLSKKIDLGTIMSRINGFVGRRDLLKLVGVEGRCDYCWRRTASC